MLKLWCRQLLQNNEYVPPGPAHYCNVSGFNADNNDAIMINMNTSDLDVTPLQGFEAQFKINITVNNVLNQGIFDWKPGYTSDGYAYPRLTINDNGTLRFRMVAAGSGSTTVDINGSQAVPINTDILVYIGFTNNAYPNLNNGTYTLKHSIDGGSTWITDGIQNTTQCPWILTRYQVGNNAANIPLQGYVDLCATYVNVTDHTGTLVKCFDQTKFTVTGGQLISTDVGRFDVYGSLNVDTNLED